MCVCDDIAVKWCLVFCAFSSTITNHKNIKFKNTSLHLSTYIIYYIYNIYALRRTKYMLYWAMLLCLYNLQTLNVLSFDIISYRHRMFVCVCAVCTRTCCVKSDFYWYRRYLWWKWSPKITWRELIMKTLIRQYTHTLAKRVQFLYRSC